MIARIRNLLAAPVFEGDDEKTRVASLLNTTLWSILAIVIVSVNLLAMLSPYAVVADLVTGVVMVLAIAGLQVLMRRGRVRLSSVLFVLLLMFMLTAVLALYGGIRSGMGAVYLLIVTMAAMLIGRRGAWAMGLLVVLVSLGLYLAEIGGWIYVEPAAEIVMIGDWVIFVTMLAMTVFLVGAAARGIERMLADVRHNQQALAESNRELADSRDVLRKQALDLQLRTVQLQAAAEVARDAAVVRDPNELLNRAVHLIAERFGFYHVDIWLLDDPREYAVLRASSSANGQQMLERGDRLRVGERSVVGTVTGSGESRLVLDVAPEEARFDSALLPGTRSEMGLPLRTAGEVIGVLDVQSRTVAAFDDEDVAVLQTLADQLGVAINNAQLLREMELAVHELEVASGGYTRQAWRTQVLGSAGRQGYRYRQLTVEPVAQIAPEALRVWEERGPVVGGEGQGAVESLAVPIEFRDQIIGVLSMRSAGRPLSPETISLVEEVSRRLALALENARLLDQTQRRAAREQLVGEITTRIRESLDMKTVLQAAARAVGEALELPAVEVHLGKGPVEPAPVQGPRSESERRR